MRTSWLQTQYQHELESLLHNIFPQHNILCNTRKPVVPNNVGDYFEVDVRLPEASLCFEFQDEYHYKYAWYAQSPIADIQQKDDIKRIKLLSDNQTLIAIPCWWSGDAESLQATIHFQRPDLPLNHQTAEITSNPPQVLFEDQSPQLMLAAFPESDVINISSWWVGEKWDGIRCYWNSADKQLYSRNKVAINLRAAKHDLFGNLVLDGELWCGRGFYQDSQAVMSSVELENRDVAFIRLLCFDEASPSTQLQPFETRYQVILSHLVEEHPIIINAPRFMCNSEDVLQENIKNITGDGGEGVMLRKPFSRYIPGRSDSLFKMKGLYAHNDQEALVEKIEIDGSLTLKLPSGILFVAAKGDCTLHRQAMPGEIVTFRILGDVPNNPSTNTEALQRDTPPKLEVYRIRSDLSWQDVVRNNPPAIVNRDHVPKDTLPTSSFNKPWKFVVARRSFFEKFARSRGMDSLNPEFWYKVTKEELRTFDVKYKSALVAKSLPNTLSQIYPDIGLQNKRFKGRNWKFKSVRKAYFDNFAAFKGADPLNPSFWYTVKKGDLVGFDKGYEKIAADYGGNLYSILVQLYPDIGLRQSRFKAQKKSWKLDSTKRIFLDKFAETKRMDPHNPLFWSSVIPSELKVFNKGFESVVTNRSALSAVLVKIYPDIGFHPQLFKGKSNKLYNRLCY